MRTAHAEVPASFSLDGRLYDSATPGNTPLLDQVEFTLQILSTDKTCILYEEKQTYDTTTSSGYFNIKVGSAVGSGKRGLGDSNHSMSEVFANGPDIAGKSLADGSACAFAPAPGAKRVVRIKVTQSDLVVRTLSPDLDLDSVPYAVASETAENLQGLTPNQILQVGTDNLNQADLQTIFSAANYTNLTSLLSYPSADYLRKGGNGSLPLPILSGDASSPIAGQFWYDSSDNVLKYYDGSAVQTVGAAGTGQFSITAGTGLTGGTVANGGTIAVDVGLGASQIVQLDGSARLPAVDGSQLSGVTASAVGASNITAGTIGGSVGMNVTENIVTTGSITGASGRFSQLLMYSGSNYVEVAAPAGVASSFKFTLPSTIGNAGEIMITDGSGNLSWVAPKQGTVTSIDTGYGLTGGPITSSGTIDLATSGVSAGTYGSANTIPSFTVDAQGRVTQAQDLVLSGLPPVGAAGGDLTGDFPNPTVWRIRGVTVSSVGPTLDGQTLRYDGTQYKAGFITIADIRSSTTGSSVLQTSCTADQTMNWNSITDVLACANIAINDSQITYASQTAKTFFAAPAGADGSPTFRTIASSDLPSLSSGLTGVLPIENGGTGATTKTAAFNALSPMTILGDLVYHNGTDVVRLAGNTLATKMVLTQTGTSTESAAPVWGTIAATDLSGVLPVASGGTGQSTLTADRIILGNGTSAVTSMAAGGNGQILQSNGTSPTWTTATYPATVANNSLLYASAADTVSALASTNNGVLLSGATGTPAWSTGSTNTVLRSTGTGVSFGQVALTTDVSGTLPIANGGTGATSLGASQLVLSNGTSALSNVASGTTGQMLRSNGASAPTWSTAIYPNTVAANSLLYASSLDNVAALAPANNSVLLSGISGTPTWTIGGNNTVLRATTAGGVAFGSVDLTTDVTGTLPVTSGGTGANSLAGLATNFVMNGGQNGAVTVGTNDASALTFVTNNTAKMTITAAGNVGIGTVSPRAKLEVNGSFTGAVAISTTGYTINYADSNVAVTTAACSGTTPFVLQNLKDGGYYNLAVKNGTAATCSFTAFSDTGSTGLTVYLPTDHGPVTSGKYSLYTFVVIGNDVFMGWVTDWNPL